MKTPYLATPDEVKMLVRASVLSSGSVIPPHGKVAMITTDGTGRVCVGAVGFRQTMQERLK